MKGKTILSFTVTNEQIPDQTSHLAIFFWGDILIFSDAAPKTS